MLTLSTERFRNIQSEAPADCQKNLIQVTKYQAARNCKVHIYYILNRTKLVLKLVFLESDVVIKREDLIKVYFLYLKHVDCFMMADVGGRKMDNSGTAKVGSVGNSFSSVCGATNLCFSKRLHIWWPCRHETTRWCWRTWILRGTYKLTYTLYEINLSRTLFYI